MSESDVDKKTVEQMVALSVDEIFIDGLANFRVQSGTGRLDLASWVDDGSGEPVLKVKTRLVFPISEMQPMINYMQNEYERARAVIPTSVTATGSDPKNKKKESTVRPPAGKRIG